MPNVVYRKWKHYIKNHKANVLLCACLDAWIAWMSRITVSVVKLVYCSSVLVVGLTVEAVMENHCTVFGKAASVSNTSKRLMNKQRKVLLQSSAFLPSVSLIILFLPITLQGVQPHISGSNPCKHSNGTVSIFFMRLQQRKNLHLCCYIKVSSNSFLSKNAVWFIYVPFSFEPVQINKLN